MSETQTVKKKTAAKKPQKKKSTRRKLTPFTRLLFFAVFLFSLYLLYRVAAEVYTTITLKRQLLEVEEKYQQVLDENEYLTREREKLEDPDYVASYARGNYMLSKDDEQIFYLPEDEDR
jgi:cell division protein DivIC